MAATAAAAVRQVGEAVLDLGPPVHAGGARDGLVRVPHTGVATWAPPASAGRHDRIEAARLSAWRTPKLSMVPQG
jgi:hypothetical protein